LFAVHRNQANDRRLDPIRADTEFKKLLAEVEEKRK